MKYPSIHLDKHDRAVTVLFNGSKPERAELHARPHVKLIVLHDKYDHIVGVRLELKKAQVMD